MNYYKFRAQCLLVSLTDWLTDWLLMPQVQNKNEHKEQWYNIINISTLKTTVKQWFIQQHMIHIDGHQHCNATNCINLNMILKSGKSNLKYLKAAKQNLVWGAKIPRKSMLFHAEMGLDLHSLADVFPSEIAFHKM